MTREMPVLAIAALVLVAPVVACGKSGEEVAKNVLHAIDQGKLVGTKGTMETLGTALRSYSVDHGGYPKTGSLQEAMTALIPAFLVAPVGPDAWGNPFDYRSDGTSFTLTSPGQDGVLGNADDVEMVDGRFTRLPAPGAQ